MLQKSMEIDGKVHEMRGRTARRALPLPHEGQLPRLGAALGPLRVPEDLDGVTAKAAAGAEGVAGAIRGGGGRGALWPSAGGPPPAAPGAVPADRQGGAAGRQLAAVADTAQVPRLAGPGAAALPQPAGAAQSGGRGAVAGGLRGGPGADLQRRLRLPAGHVAAGAAPLAVPGAGRRALVQPARAGHRQGAGAAPAALAPLQGPGAPHGLLRGRQGL